MTRVRESGYGFDNRSGAEATRTDADSFAGALEDDANALEVGVPNPLRHIVRVADLVSVHRSLAADAARTGHFVPPRAAQTTSPCREWGAL